MTKKEKLFLKMRNKRGEGQKDETYCMHYKKKFGGYLFNTFFSFQSLSLFIVGLVITLFVVLGFSVEEDGYLIKVVAMLIGGFADFFWVYFIVFKLWYWKYSKHIFVTDEGIWIAVCSTFWWKGAPDFRGKVKFWAPSWSLYSWSELKKVSDNKKDRPRSPVKLANFFEDIDTFFKDITGLKTIYLTRWDGVEEVNFVSKADAEEILNYYKSQKRARRRSKKDKVDELITD